MGANYVHEKGERKIKEVKRSIEVWKTTVSLLQWETLIQYITNTVNKLPIGLGNRVASLEELDLITPDRLLLGRKTQDHP